MKGMRLTYILHQFTRDVFVPKICFVLWPSCTYG